MIRLARSLDAWGRPEFEEVLKEEIATLGAVLPLQQGLSQGSYSDDKVLSVMLIGAEDKPRFIQIKAGIFYTSVIAGCSCADDPTPVDNISEYSELQIDIDKTTAEAVVTLLS